jgi:hypothetical protein
MTNGKWKMENGKWKMENGKITPQNLSVSAYAFEARSLVSLSGDSGLDRKRLGHARWDGS